MRPLPRGTWVYAASLAIFAGIVVLILSQSGRIEKKTRLAAMGEAGRSLSDPRSRTRMSVAAEPIVAPAAPTTPIAGSGLTVLHSPLALLLAQLSVVVGFAGACGLLARRLGQPAVIGEMTAGIALGPSLLGHLFPGFSQALFPADSLGTLNSLSQIGVILFLFSMGMEIDLGSLRRHARQALFVSHAGIVAPFLLGMGAALFLYAGFAPPQVRFATFALFLGSAMSITAFPVLARILAERNLLATSLGHTAMASAAVDDVTAWILLALIIAVAKATSLLSAAGVALTAFAYALFMVFAVRSAARRLPVLDAAGHPKRGAALAALIVLFLSSLCTETIGIHALFGAFLAGLAMPSVPAFRTLLRERLEYPASLFLLPVFFASTGLRMRAEGLIGAGAWGVFPLLLALAVAGKLGGVGLAARATGAGWREAFALGTLMNTRGLMELIVLNVGLDLGILSPRLFTLMALVALATTAMTGPLLDRILGKDAGAPGPPVSAGSRANVPRGL